MMTQRREMGASKSGLLLTGLLLAALVLPVITGCGRGRRPPVPEGSALWIGEASAALDGSALSFLRSSGVEHLFGEAAVLEWVGDRPRLTERSRLQVPPRTPVFLVLRGAWRDGLDPGAVAQALAGEVRRVSLEADGMGLVTAGVHFEVDAAGELETYGRTLDLLRGELPRELLISAGVRRSWLEDDALPAVVAGVDFTIAWLYGQRPDEMRRFGWEAEAWDLGQVDLALRRLEALETPYLVGVVTLGSTMLLDSSGRVRDLRPGGPLRPLVRHPSLRLDHGFVLTGMDCRRYDFTAEATLELDGWTVQRGHHLRSLTLGPTRVREYRLLLPVLDLRHRLGDVFYRLPAPGDRLSVGLDGFREALSPKPRQGRLEVDLEEVRSGGRSLVLRARLKNPGTEATEVAFVDRNYLELETLSGRFGRIDPGEFQRYQLFRRDAAGKDRLSLRNANVLRLFEPVVDAGGEVRSGSLEVIGGRGLTKILWRLSYLLGDGSELTQASQDDEEDSSAAE